MLKGRTGMTPELVRFFCCCDQNTRESNLEVGKVYFGSCFKGFSPWLFGFMHLGRSVCGRRFFT
jgi:hypothetical protein